MRNKTNRRIVMNDLVKKWTATGLLDDFKGKYPSSKELREEREKKTWQKYVAEYLEEFANDMLKDKNRDKDFNGMGIPLVRRIYDEGNGLKAEYKKMKEIYNELNDNFVPKIKHSYEIDFEAELCALVAETYVEKYGDNAENEL